MAQPAGRPAPQLVKSIPERFVDRQLDAVLDATFQQIKTAA